MLSFIKNFFWASPKTINIKDCVVDRREVTKLSAYATTCVLDSRAKDGMVKNNHAERYIDFDLLAQHLKPKVLPETVYYQDLRKHDYKNAVVIVIVNDDQYSKNIAHLANIEKMYRVGPHGAYAHSHYLTSIMIPSTYVKSGEAISFIFHENVMGYKIPVNSLECFHYKDVAYEKERMPLNVPVAGPDYYKRQQLDADFIAASKARGEKNHPEREFEGLAEKEKELDVNDLPTVDADFDWQSFDGIMDTLKDRKEK